MENEGFTTAENESLPQRLRIMMQLAPGIVDDSPRSLAERVQASGRPTTIERVRRHLDGSETPTAADRAAYARACQWHDDTSLLSDDPRRYLLPLVQAEILLSLRLIGMPHSRGPRELGALARMSVRELRQYRAHLFSRERSRLLTG